MLPCLWEVRYCSMEFMEVKFELLILFPCLHHLPDSSLGLSGSYQHSVVLLQHNHTRTDFGYEGFHQSAVHHPYLFTHALYFLPWSPTSASFQYAPRLKIRQKENVLGCVSGGTVFRRRVNDHFIVGSHTQPCGGSGSARWRSMLRKSL